MTNWALGVEPFSLDEEYKSEDQSEWERVMDAEIASLVENGTFAEAQLPAGRSAIKSK